MRQAPQDLGVMQRQVTARPVATLQAQQQNINIDPNSNAFAKGLMDFADASMGAVKKQVDEDLEAQAAVADIGLDGYNKAMGAALDSQPELFEDQEALGKLDQEMRERYFNGVSDERILSRANMRIDGFLQTAGQTYQYAKAEKQRFDLGSRTLQLSVEKLEEQVKLGAITEEQATGELKSIVGYLRKAPAFRISQENTEKLVQGLQDAFSKDGSRRMLLAKAFGDDPEISVDTQLALRADYAEGMKATEAEKQTAKFELYKSWEPLIERGKFTWAEGEKAVKAGLVSADDVRSGLRRQKTLIEKRIAAAQKDTQLLTADPRTLDGPNFTKWEALLRKEKPKDEYYAIMRQTGGVNPVVKAQAQRAFSTSSRPVESEDQIPAAFKTFMEGDASYLYGAGMLSQHIPPEQLEDTATYLYLTQTLGKEPVEAYNLTVEAASAKYSDIDKLRQSKLKSEVRSKLDIDGNAANTIVDSTVSVAMKLSKIGLDPDESVTTALKWTKDAYTVTDYGAIPKARYGTYTSEEGLKKRLDFTAQELVKELKADGHEADTSDLQVNLLDDGRFFYVRKGGYVPIGSKAFRLMTDNNPELPDGTQTVEGARQDEIINEQLKPKPSRAGRTGGPLIGGG